MKELAGVTIGGAAIATARRRQALRLASTLTWQALAATDATLSSLAEGRD